MGKTQISETEFANISATANDPAFQQLAKAYTSIADLGLQNMNGAAAQTLIDSAITSVNGAIAGITDLQSTLGITQSRISDASKRLGLQTNYLQSQIASTEAVDPYAAAAAVSSLTTQLETAYSLTARIGKLSLIDYL